MTCKRERAGPCLVTRPLQEYIATTYHFSDRGLRRYSRERGCLHEDRQVHGVCKYEDPVSTYVEGPNSMPHNIFRLGRPVLPPIPNPRGRPQRLGMGRRMNWEWLHATDRV